MDISEDISFRMVRRDDTEILLDYINTLSKERTYIMYQGRQLTYEVEDRYIENFMKDVEMGNAVKILAFHADTLVGVADAVRSTYETEPHVCTFGIMLKKEWRGKGIGSVLMDKTLEAISTHMAGISIIRLGVFGNNPIAERMYRKKGFVQYGLLPQGLRHKEEYVDHIFMYKRLES